MEGTRTTGRGRTRRRAAAVVPPEPVTVEVRGVPIGPGTFTVLAGPRAVDTPQQALAAARAAMRAGATVLRGGALGAGRSCPDVTEQNLRILADVRAETGLPLATEVNRAGDVALVARYADMLHVVGSGMRDRELLAAVAAAGVPVLLDRDVDAGVEEWLAAAAAVTAPGGPGVVLCERGVRADVPGMRLVLDVGVVSALRRFTGLPVVVDASRCGGGRDLVLPLSRSAIVADADGVAVDVAPSGGDERSALDDADLYRFSDSVSELGSHLGRRVRRRLSIAA